MILSELEGKVLLKIAGRRIKLSSFQSEETSKNFIKEE